MTNAGEKRWDRDPFADRPPIGPEAELHVCRLQPAELSGKLDKIVIGGKGMHPLEVLGVAYGGNPATYSLSLRDRVGRGKQQTFFALGNVTVHDFGEPKIPMELPTHAAEPPKVRTAPAPSKEGGTMEPPPMVQTPQEALAAAAQNGDRMLLQMLAPVLAQAINAQGPEFQRRVLEALTRIDERQARQDERLARLEAQQADEATRGARNEELLGRLLKQIEGTPIQSVEQGKALIQRLGPAAFGIVENEPAEEDRYGWIKELVAPHLPALIAWLMSRSPPEAGAAIAQVAMAAAAEAPPEPEPPEPPPAPPGPRRAPATLVMPRRNGNGHAGPGRADAGT